MRSPDFFIVGAPKCGTTALNSYLAQHPEIFMSPEKELHFFGSDLEFKDRPAKSREDYLYWFSGAADEKRLGEASVWYLYSKRAAVEIRDFCPEARIIVMLKNPVDMMHSQHSQFLYNNNEDIECFETALEAEAGRRQGQRLPPGAHFVAGLLYRETARYSEQLERYFEVFSRDRVQVIVFDDFRDDTGGCYRRTLEFLGVDPSFEIEFPVINSNKTIRSRWFRCFLDHPPRALSAPARLFLRKETRRWLWKRLQRLNTHFVRRPPLDPDLRGRLLEGFESEVTSLGQLIDRDLSHWIRPGDSSPDTRKEACESDISNVEKTHSV